MTLGINDTDGRPVPARGGGRSPAVFGIRALAALALLTIHVAMFSGLLGTRALGTPRPPSNPVGAFFVSGLPSFIGVFFVLPAMFLYLPLAKAIIAGEPLPSQRSGLIRRLLRLLPGYYLMYFVVLVTLNRHAITGFWYVLRPILLLQVYLPSPFVPKLMNGMEVTWTVPTMVQWYALLPVIAWASQKYAVRGPTPAARARRLMLPVPFLIALGVGWLFFVKAWGWDNRIVFWWPQGFAPTIGIGMGLAVLIALAKVSPPDTSRILRAAGAHPHLFWLAALAVYLVNCARPFSVIGMDAIYSTSGLLITYLMVAAFGLLAVLPLVVPGGTTPLIRTVLTPRPLVYIGRISYGVYLWHFAIMHFFLQPGSMLGGTAKPLRELYGTSSFWALEAATLAGSVFMASISYYLVEQPIAAWGDRFIQRRFIERGERGGQQAAERVHVELPRPRTEPVPAVPISREEATEALAAAAADRAAIEANLLELDRAFNDLPATDADLPQEVRERWEAAAADLTSLWELFGAYTAVVEQASQAFSGLRRPSDGALARIGGLLAGPAVVVTRAPAPLARRRITDSGRTCYTVAAAIEEMNTLFGAVAAAVAAFEEAWAAAPGG